MQLVILAIASFACSGLAYISEISWISIFGFGLGVILWVLARKMRQTGQSRPFTTVFMVLGIIATFANLWAIFVAFFLSALLEGGPVIM